ncbi:unnamed protein product, partial [Discosporangium mesarthrocarpum]
LALTRAPALPSPALEVLNVDEECPSPPPSGAWGERGRRAAGQNLAGISSKLVGKVKNQFMGSPIFQYFWPGDREGQRSTSSSRGGGRQANPRWGGEGKGNGSQRSGGAGAKGGAGGDSGKGGQGRGCRRAQTYNEQSALVSGGMRSSSGQGQPLE